MSACPQIIYSIRKKSDHDGLTDEFIAVALPGDNTQFVLAHIYDGWEGRDVASYMTFRDECVGFVGFRTTPEIVKAGIIPPGYEPHNAEEAQAFIARMDYIMDQ